MIAAKGRFIQLKFLHRAFYTPQRLASIYLSLLCTRCALELGTFFHIVWSCPKLRLYWQVANTLGDIWGIDIPLEPLILLLSYLNGIEGDHYVKLCITLYFMLGGKSY